MSYPFSLTCPGFPETKLLTDNEIYSHIAGKFATCPMHHSALLVLLENNESGLTLYLRTLSLFQQQLQGPIKQAPFRKIISQN